MEYAKGREKNHILLPTVDQFNDKGTYQSGKSSML